MEKCKKIMFFFDKVISIKDLTLTAFERNIKVDCIKIPGKI